MPFIFISKKLPSAICHASPCPTCKSSSPNHTTVFTILKIVTTHAKSSEKLAPKLDITFSASYLCSTPPTLTQPHEICHPVSPQTLFHDFFVRFSATARNL